jgi:tetratricopeptide (TPR) repeat protein
VKLLERGPPSPELVLAYTHLARYYHFLEPGEPVFAWVEKAMATAKEIGIEGWAMRALVFRGFTRFELGDLGGLDDLKRALQIGLELGLGEETAAAHLALGDVVWWMEGPAAGLDVYRAGIDFTQRRGMTYYTMYLKGQAAWPLFELGEWDALLKVTREVLEWDRASYQALLALPYEGHVRLLRGEVGDALALREEFLPRARQSRDPQVLVPALATSALIDERRGDLSSAVAVIEEFEEVTRDRAMWRAKHLPDLLRVCTAAGATAQAETLLAGVEVAAARHRHAVHSARGVVAEAKGQLEQSLELYEEAAERWSEYGFVLEEGQALLGAGRCLLTLHRPDEAAKRLQRAKEIFQALDARLLVAEADRLLEQAAAFAS